VRAASLTSIGRDRHAIHMTSCPFMRSVRLMSVGVLSAVTLHRPAIADKLDTASIPSGAVYICAGGSGTGRKIAAIKLESKVAELCRRHTEMGPCQSARNACRRGGGRVYAADGSEVTQADEAEFDKKVLRARVGP
jgi:hypothetical protein